MVSSGPLTVGAIAQKLIKFVFYCLILLSLQARLVEDLSLGALRIDLILPVMFAIAVECSPLAGLFWAGLLGFIVDNFSGEFWGLHVGSYVVTVCLVHMASERFDWSNPAYQVALIGLCALGQSLALGLFLSLVPMDVPAPASIWISLSIRAILSATTAPFIIYPLLSSRYSI